ncbi:MAG TPA: phosphoglucosamine mutase [Actinobacteria bacterium]|nr:phosphoglucosamine mutase [Actinomycetota bacterium]
MSRLFGTDGVRGIANLDLNGELAFRLGRAAVVVLTEHGERRPHIVVGRDTRGNGEFLEAALVAGICSAGGDAVTVGVCTTPGIAFLTTDLGAQAGAVISASHNPAEYNGIKFFGSSGYKLPDEVEQEIESVVDRDAGPRPTGPAVGRVSNAPDAEARYLAHLVSVADGRLDGMRVVVDCANGAAFDASPRLLRSLGAEVLPLNDSPDGWNINAGCGATHPDVVARAVVEAGADAGVAHDGDADRALFADHLGNVVDGDQVLAACAVDLKERGELPGDLLVVTVMANLGLRLAMAEAGVQLAETRVGDRYVLEEMRRSGAALGGEQSGHVIFLRHATTGDGLLTSVQFLTLASRKGVTLADLGAAMKKFPQVLLNVTVRDRDGLAEERSVWQAIREAEAALGDQGRVLVRASGTEPLIRVMVEAATEEQAAVQAEALARTVRTALG